MSGSQRALVAVLAASALALFGAGQRAAHADSANEIDEHVDVVLEKLFSEQPAAAALAHGAAGILVFPGVVKAGFVFGGQYGEGALRVNGLTEGYYSSVAASYGLQAGVQKFGYALFFMSESALHRLHSSDGWEIGVGPSVVVVDQGMATTLTTTTAQADVYAFFFNQEGLMAGLGLQGTKITKLDKH